MLWWKGSTNLQSPSHRRPTDGIPPSPLGGRHLQGGWRQRPSGFPQVGLLAWAAFSFSHESGSSPRDVGGA